MKDYSQKTLTKEMKYSVSYYKQSLFNLGYTQISLGYDFVKPTKKKEVQGGTLLRIHIRFQGKYITLHADIKDRGLHKTAVMSRNIKTLLKDEYAKICNWGHSRGV